MINYDYDDYYDFQGECHYHGSPEVYRVGAGVVGGLMQRWVSPCWVYIAMDVLERMNVDFCMF